MSWPGCNGAIRSRSRPGTTTSIPWRGSSWPITERSRCCCRAISARRSRSYDDVPELELRDASGNPVAEADLIAVGDDEVIVAEAKSNDALGGNPREVKRAAAKRVRLADVLRADQIVLATTRPEWSASSITEIRSAVTGHTWPAGLRPAVRLITGLGGNQVEDLRLDLASGATAKWRSARSCGYRCGGVE